MLLRLFLATCFLAIVGALPAQTRPLKKHLAPTKKLNLQNVTIENARLLSAQEEDQIVKKIHEAGAEFSANPEPEGLAEGAKERVQAAYQDKGYFLAKVSANVVRVAGETAGRQVNVTVQVLNEGQQYRLRDIHCKNMTAFSEQQLLDVIPIHPGEIFSRGKIAEGLEALRRLYGSHGYINFTSIPNTEIDDENASIALNIDVDEGGVFRFRNLSIVGLDDPKVEQFQRAWEQLRGQPYSHESLRSFFDQLVRSVPPGVDPVEYTNTRLDERARTVDVSITFAPPPLSRKTQH